MLVAVVVVDLGTGSRTLTSTGPITVMLVPEEMEHQKAPDLEQVEHKVVLLILHTLLISICGGGLGGHPNAFGQGTGGDGG